MRDDRNFAGRAALSHRVLRRTLVLGAVLTGVFAKPAAAAQVSVQTTPNCAKDCGQILVYRAALSETNHVTFSPGESGGVMVHDPGIDVAAGPQCRVNGTGSATCDLSPQWIEAHLGDGDDSADARTALTQVLLFGDGGDDRLIASGPENVLTGGRGNDVLEVQDQAADADTTYLTTADYHDTRQPVRANLATGIVRVGVDEIDRVVGIRSLTGGRGDDRLTGTALADRLAGGDGNDHLVGAGGPDDLEGGRGADRLTGGPGNDAFGLGEDGRSDTAQCGHGRDRVGDSTDLADIVSRDCETVDGPYALDVFRILPTPRPRVYLARHCEGETLDYRLRLRLASTGRTIALARHRCTRSRPSLIVRIEPQIHGSDLRLLQRARRVLVRVEVTLARGEGGRHGFTIDLAQRPPKR